MKLTTKQIETYLAHDGLRCPACESDQLTCSEKLITHDTTDGNKIYQLCECMDCRLKWHEVYSLTGIEITEGE